MNDIRIKKLIACNVPISACNLRCHYCYISQRKNWDCGGGKQKLDPGLIEKALSYSRLGGPCIINLTGKGETLIPEEMPDVIYRLLKQGHYLEVVTNGTLSDRFDVIAQFPHNLLERLEFKFSFHYLELKKKNWLNVFFDNVNKMKSAGCSFTVELMPNDELVPFLDDIIKICQERVGANCHLTIGRDELDNKNILTKLDIQDYLSTWQQFESKMFEFKYSVFGVKRKEFCYAGMWSLYVDLISGDARQCYGCLANQNIYKNVNSPIYFRPIGHGCKQEFCYNAHAFMTLGIIPELQTPTYADIRDRVDVGGKHWLTECVISAFSSKLADSNRQLLGINRFLYYLSYPFYGVKVISANKGLVIKKIKRILGK